MAGGNGSPGADVLAEGETNDDTDPIGGARDEAPKQNDDRPDGLRFAGTAFGTVAGATLLLLSGVLGSGRPDAAQIVALYSFATALPLLVCSSVGAYALSLLHGHDHFTTASQRASGATSVLGWLGTLGVVIGITALLWRLIPGAALAFIGCSLVALVVLSVFTRPVTPLRRARRG